MKAVSCFHGDLEVVDLPSPRPDDAQLLLDVLRCGICGSDLHAKDHADELTEVFAEGGYHDFVRSDTPVVMGHEFCGVVAERGRKAGKEFTPGTTVVSFPLLRAHGGVHLTGLSPKAPGGYAEQVLAEAALTFVVPNGLDPSTAALTEPMAVAYHAVRRSDITGKDVAIVLGCGPVGLAVICHLKARGVRTIVASDFSPGRRALATRCGADIVVDPAEDSPYDAVPAKQRGLTELPALYELGIGAMEKLRKIPAWSHVYRVADRLGGTAPKRPVIFECVGVPGMIDGAISAAPLASRVIVVGVCMGEDKLRPAMAIGKEIDLRFVFGYTPLEFRDTLHMLADGKVDASPLVTGTVGLDGVAGAFADLGNPEKHAKILIDPSR
ncbi:zinc-binding dehydrogenase [Mycolicibacterium parafortuitum]|uniref:Putative dehydrogenase [Mycobacterium tuberculosis H37Rv] n=1 Tax=Mycolicibacterium parafortuitum TaxID=39692 RepID=A0A375YD19_MYCPF|nr:zinc-binding dehydrogenase [Mycolicibacterium parafortuitum]ORB24975.1 alcohol dehydrogenase [Mycolicibacterium parafortuitum]SRX78958.1 putative dehydrogenase [Mycobacterium tuberculosis H37Rv] [Mycolicibacterium parafortuitum]